LRGAREISGWAALPWSFQGECRALRIRALDDPASARCFKRAFENLSAASRNTLCGRVDIGSIEIIEPKRSWDPPRFGEHAANHLLSG